MSMRAPNRVSCQHARYRSGVPAVTPDTGYDGARQTCLVVERDPDAVAAAGVELLKARKKVVRDRFSLDSNG